MPSRSKWLAAPRRLLVETQEATWPPSLGMRPVERLEWISEGQLSLGCMQSADWQSAGRFLAGRKVRVEQWGEGGCVRHTKAQGIGSRL